MKFFFPLMSLSINFPEIKVNCTFFSLQIQKVVIALGDYQGAQCHACIGGTNVREDIRKLEMGVHVVVGTPGRVMDMISRKALSKFSFFC